MGGFFKRLFRHRFQTWRATERVREADTVHDADLSWFFPPSTVVDPKAWDQYWHDQISHGLGMMAHMFVNDGALVDAMRANEFKTVLCVGNGISQEPRALAWAGFDVTALDLSPFATEAARAAMAPKEFLSQLVDGRSGGLYGRLEFVVGDLCDSSSCPGPYDVVIERKTLQLFADDDRAAAMQVVANRLASRGIFFSHAHDGGWQPPAQPRHATEAWFRAEGWPFWYGDGPLTTKVAWLFTSTG